MSDLSGKEVKGYILEELINDGGFGAVYRAYQPSVDREVAIKVILPQYANHPDFIRGFEFEAQLVARVEHPHIIPLYDFWREPDGAYLVMRWLRGGNLREALAHDKWDMSLVVRVFDQIAEALYVAHQQGVVHRDIKPDNILLDQHRNAFLTDFGIARDLVGNRDAFNDGALIGSPPYLSPEQILRREITPQSDIYSLGIVLFELLTGKLPFSDPSVTQLLNQHVNDPMPSLYELRPDLPLAVNAVIWRATAKEARARYPNALAFAEDFREVVMASRGNIAGSTGIFGVTQTDTMDVTGQVASQKAGPYVNDQVDTLAFDDPSNPTLTDTSDSLDEYDIKTGIVPTGYDTVQLDDAIKPDTGSLDSRVFNKPQAPPQTDTLQFETEDETPANTMRFGEDVEAPTDTLRFATGAPVNEEDPTNTRRFADDSPSRRIRASQQRYASASIPVVNPYKGLRPFEEADARDFFGRDTLVRQIIRRMTETDENSRFLAVIGPSGSGKSSVVKAGLIPSLRQGAISGSNEWFFVSMVPGGKPLDRLSAALLSAAASEPPNLLENMRISDGGLYRAVKQIVPEGSQLLLFIDQFEEVFTLVEDERARVHFLNSLSFALAQEDTPLRVIVTLRADYYDKPLLYTGIGDLIRTRTEVVLPLRPGELEQAILRPAERVGLTIERSLIAAVIADISESPGSLPLLQYTMTEVFERRDDMRLKLSSYRDLGGVSGALARRADEIYNEFDERRQQITRQLFLRMVTIGDSGEATRRRVFWTELTSISTDKDLLENVINLFTRYRLITLDHDQQTRVPTVEVAHEALIRSWEKLQQWIDTSREDLRVQRRMATATREWQNAGRDPSFLASGARLEQFETLSQKPDLALTDQERAYLDESIALRLRNRARLRLFIASLIAFALIALVFAGFALDRQNRAVVERDRADLQSRIARSGELAVISLTNRDQVDLALLLGLEALDTADTFEARNSLLTALQEAPRVEKFLHGHTDGVRAVDFSTDGAQIVSAGRDYAVRQWDTQSGEQIRTLEGHTDWVNAVAFSPDGTIIASGGNDRTLRLWDAENGQALGEPITLPDAVWSLAFDDNGHIAAGSADSTVTVWDVETREMIFEPLTAHTDFVYAVRYSPDGAILASAGADTTVRLWDAATGEPLGEALTGHLDWIYGLSFSPNGRVLASADTQGRVILWEVEARAMAAEFDTNHTDWIRSIVFSPDGQLLVTASADSTVRIWNLMTGGLYTPPLSAHRSDVWGVDFNPDGHTLVSAGEDGLLILWDIATDGLSRMTLSDHRDTVEAASFTPDGQTIVSVGGLRDDFAMRVWDATSGQLRQTVEGHNAPLTGVTFSPDGNYMATSGGDLRVILWNAQNFDMIHELIAHESVVWSVDFNRDGTRLASSDDFGVVLIWDVEEGVLALPPMQGHEDAVNAVVFSPVTDVLVSGGADGKIVFWDAVTGESIGEIPDAHDSEITTLAFSPDGTMLASGSRDESLKLWDVATREMIREPLTGHTDYVWDLDFSPDGMRLVSASHDDTFILWDIETGRSIGRPFTGHTDWVNDVEFSPDGTTLLTASRDGTLRLWNVELEQWRQRACSVANRSLTDEEWTRYFRDEPYHDTCAALVSSPSG